jgi:PAS domain S-box-containing protein
MLASPGFYAQLSALFDHMARDPGMTPAIALQQWLAGSEEVHHLEELQEALAALQACVYQECQSRAVGEEQPYRSIFEAVGDGLIIVDRETGRVVEANPAAGALHGYAREELIGLPITYLIHPDSHRLFNQHAELMLWQKVVTRAREQATLLEISQTLASSNGQAAVLLQGVRAWMWVPLTAKGHMIGGLGIAHAEPAPMPSRIISPHTMRPWP